MATTMYRIGDYVYVDTNPGSPYLIRRIEELNKNQLGNVEAKMMCFYRRRDLPNPLIQLADKHQPALDEGPTSPVQVSAGPPIVSGSGNGAVSSNITNIEKCTTAANIESKSVGDEVLTAKQRYQIKHRELFLSRQVETLPATQIRGKCSVTLLNETESLQSYLNKDDTFFYCLVFDPNHKTLLADKGEIRVGSRYQSEIPAKLKDTTTDERKLEDHETLLWTTHHDLTDRKIDQFLVVSRSIGTFARALDCNSSVKQPSLHMSAAAASRDITLFHAMNLLHEHNYSIEEAMCSLVPSTGPILCRDEIEDWSAAEANLFEEALDKYGKDFNDIRQDFLPWKTLKQIIEYYYMWKTTDRYVQQKRVKAVEAELKLKQVYVPQFNSNAKTTSNMSINVSNQLKNSGLSIYNGTANGNVSDSLNNGRPCESCATLKSSQWYPWTAGHLTCRLCQSCWDYWKKYGGLKMLAKHIENVSVATIYANDNESKKKNSPTNIMEVSEEEKVSDLSCRQQHKCSIVNCGKEFKLKTHLARHYAQAHGIALNSSSPRPIMKTRTAFYLHANAMTRLARILCRNLIKPRRAARQTSYAINTQLVKQEFSNSILGKSAVDLKHHLILRRKNRGSVTKIANRLGSPGVGPHEWLILTPRDQMQQPDVVSFPKPPKAPDGSLIYERVPNKIPDIDKDLVLIPTNMASATMQNIRKRASEDKQLNGTETNIIPTGPPSKRPIKDPMPSHCPSPEQFAAMMAASGQPLSRHHLNGKPKIAQMGRAGNGRKQVISWMDAPDDVYFRANEASKKARKILSPQDIRRSARKPWRNLSIKPNIVESNLDANNRLIEPQVVILD